MEKFKFSLMLKAISCFMLICLSFNNYADVVELNWNKLIHLDAEFLAEQGVKESYQESILPELKQYVEEPLSIEEIFNRKTCDYKVIAGSKIYVIHDPIAQNTLRKAYDSWGYATYALFDIVNQQLLGSDYKFYAFNSGNELSGMFLTPSEYQNYQKALCQDQRISDCPYFPTLDLPWFGQPHH